MTESSLSAEQGPMIKIKRLLSPVKTFIISSSFIGESNGDIVINSSDNNHLKKGFIFL